MAKPKVITNCVANKHTGPNERIVEFNDPEINAGGLISFNRTNDGKLRVDLYCLDANVVVNVGKENLLVKAKT